MSVLDLVRGKLALVGLAARGRDQAIAELVDFMIDEGELPGAHREPVLEAAYRREQLRPTATQHGIALPHAITDAVPDEVGAIATAPGGVPWDGGLDGQPVRLVILVLSPTLKQLTRVHTLKRIGRLGTDRTLCDALLRAPNRQAALQLLTLLGDDGASGAHERRGARPSVRDA